MFCALDSEQGPPEPEPRVQTADHRASAQNPEYRVQSTEIRAQNTGHRDHSTETRTQISELRA